MFKYLNECQTSKFIKIKPFAFGSPNYLSKLCNLQLIIKCEFCGPCMQWLTKLTTYPELTNSFSEYPAY